MQTFQNISIEQIREIADRYGLDWNDEYDRTRIIEPEARQADEFHGRPCKRLHDGRNHWGAGDCGDSYDAALLLDGYLAQVTHTMEADCASIAKFHRDAYGE